MPRSEYHPPVEVRGLVPRDLPVVVEIHARAFPSAAMTRLGRGTLCRYYDWLLHGPHDANAIGAVAGGRLAGFCFGGVFRDAIGGFVRRNRGYMAGQILRRPHLLVSSLFRARLRSGLGTVRAPAERPLEGAGPFRLLVIAVDPAAQGRGVGAALMRAAEAEASARRFARMRLGVDPANRRAIEFYERLGWTRTDPPGGWTVNMTKTLGT